MPSLLPNGTLLRFHRLNRGFTQRELALRARTSEQYVSELERGIKHGGVKGWKRLADALGVEVSDLIERTEQTA